MAIEITQDMRELLKILRADPPFDIRDHEATDPPLPAIATIREFDIGITAGQLDPKYITAKYEVDVTTYPGGLQEVLRRVQDGSLPLTDDSKPKSPFKTPLCIQNKKHCYVIIKLSGVNWQFSNNRPPFSVNEEGYRADVYRQARRADAQGNDVEPHDIENNCRIAYLVSDGLTASGGNPTNPQPYGHGFNFNLDLITKDSNGNPAYIPIVIDPDIRYPGGSGP